MAPSIDLLAVNDEDMPVLGLNGHANKKVDKIANIDPSRLKVTLTDSPKPIPSDAQHFGQTYTDHMLIMSFDPNVGWSTPEIKPYGPLALDPASNVLQYSSTLFEGMKAYAGPDGEPRLFRPELNMKRMARSAERLALPSFDTNAFLVLIKRLISIEKRWLPNQEGHALYIRPTMIGTSTTIKVGASTHAMLYVILAPSQPYFHSTISLFAVSDIARSWPQGTGEYKLGVNYSPGFAHLRTANELGYEQCLWLLGEDKKVTEAGAMNIFAVVRRDDGDWDIITPPLDSTILPGITRLSVLELCAAHGPSTSLDLISSSKRLHVFERVVTLGDLASWNDAGKLLEIIVVGTAVLVCGVSRIGHNDGGKVSDIVLPAFPDNALGPVAQALYNRLWAIQSGRFEWKGWSTRCE